MFVLSPILPSLRLNRVANVSTHIVEIESTVKRVFLRLGVGKEQFPVFFLCLSYLMATQMWVEGLIGRVSSRDREFIGKLETTRLGFDRVDLPRDL